jgi:hypothetical protein
VGGEVGIVASLEGIGSVERLRRENVDSVGIRNTVSLW